MYNNYENENKGWTNRNELINMERNEKKETNVLVGKGWGFVSEFIARQDKLTNNIRNKQTCHFFI